MFFYLLLISQQFFQKKLPDLREKSQVRKKYIFSGRCVLSESDQIKINSEKANKAYTGSYCLSGSVGVLYQLYHTEYSFAKDRNTYLELSIAHSKAEKTKQKIWKNTCFSN